MVATTRFPIDAMVMCCNVVNCNYCIALLFHGLESLGFFSTDLTHIETHSFRFRFRKFLLFKTLRRKATIKNEQTLLLQDSCYHC